MTIFNDTFDKATPTGSDDPAEADDRMREIKGAVQERENVDHYWPLTGTEVSDTDAGEHRKVTLRVASAPTAVADKGIVYAKDVSAKAELFYRDEDGNEIQITTGGVLNVSTLQDGAVLAAATEAADPARTVADKAFVDAVDSADDFTPSAYAGEESVTLPNGMIMKMGQTARTDNNTAVAFGDAFPNAVISIIVTAQDDTTTSLIETPTVNIPTVNGFSIYAEQFRYDPYHWIAIGH